MTDDSSRARGFIAGVIALGIIGLAVALFFLTPSEASLQVLTGLLSALTLALGAVVQFYFGSSSGAKTLVSSQNETVKTLAAAVATSTPANPLGDGPTGKPGDPVEVKQAPTDDPQESALVAALARLRASRADTHL